MMYPRLTVRQRVKITNGSEHHGRQGTVVSVGNGPGLSVRVDDIGLRFNVWEVEEVKEPSTSAYQPHP